MTTRPNESLFRHTAEEYRAKARESYRRKEESWDRSDTDGALSQWASGLTARENDLKASLVEQGGVSTFPALYFDGKRVTARLVRTDYGMRWLVLNAAGKPALWASPVYETYTEEWDGQEVERSRLAKHPSKRSKLGKLGFEQGYEEAPANVKLSDGDMVNCRPIVYRCDEGYPADAVPYEGPVKP